MVQKLPLFSTFFLGNIGKENAFYDILERKNSFLGYKNKRFKKSKNWHFYKGVNSWFLSKNDHYTNLFFLGNIGKENVFHDIPELQNSFLGYKNKKFKKSKIDIFYKGLTHGFRSKIAIFFPFFFRQYRQGKCLLRYFTTKKLLSRL